MSFCVIRHKWALVERGGIVYISSDNRKILGDLYECERCHQAGYEITGEAKQDIPDALARHYARRLSG